MIWKRFSEKAALPAFVLSIFLTSCSGLRNLKDDQYLLNKSIIKTDRKEYREEMQTILKQKPNRKILGIFRFHLGIYMLANQGKDTTKFKEWVKNTIGEAPVILDSNLTRRSTDQLGIYIRNHGYFNAVVNDTTILKKSHKANVIYTVNAGIPYTIKSVNYHIKDPEIASIIINDSTNCLVKAGKNYDTGNLQKERDRLSNMLKNKGYYFFNPLYITYSIDTGLRTNQAVVYMQIANPGGQNDTNTFSKHKPYNISNVYIQTDFDPISEKQLVPVDTLLVKGYHFIASSYDQKYKPNLLLQHVFIKPGSLFRLEDLEKSYKALQNLGVFKFINIKYERTDDDDSLICYILLTPLPRQDYKLEAEGTNTGGNIGLSGNVGYRNKNTFKGAEQFDFRLKGGIEAQQEISDSTQENSNLTPFNTYEIGPEMTLGVPRILFPGAQKLKFNTPLTNFISSYNYQQRTEYKRTIANLSLSYSWKETTRKRHYIFPGEINFVKVDLQQAFEQKLIDMQDPALLASYEDQFISNGRYTFIYNSQDLSRLKNYVFFKSSIEYAGNTLWLYHKLNKTVTENDEPIEMFNVPFAQYIRPDVNLTYYQVFSENTQMAYHLAGGVGFAYGNSELMPFVKSFYAGGSNDLRAWRARSLGPGSYPNNEAFEKSGDVKINANVEYRFDIFRKLEGALFADAGNIWLVKDDPSRPGGHFKADTFLEEVAIGSGLGLRLDFTFFILRFDWGIKLKDPSRPPGERWIIKEAKTRNTLLNFGIGYPF